MIDDSDADDFWLIALITDNPIIIVLALVAGIVFGIIAVSNSQKCSTRHCPDGQTPKLMNHECLCVTRAR